MPMTAPFDGYVERLASVSSTCLVAVARNRCSVPCKLVGRMVSTRLYPNEVVVLAADAVVARHARLYSKTQTRYDRQRYVPLIQRKPGALRNGAPFEDLPAPLQTLRPADPDGATGQPSRCRFGNHGAAADAAPVQFRRIMCDLVDAESTL
jgi:hypothetical protein